MSADTKHKEILERDNILQNIPDELQHEIFEDIFKTDQLHVERIVSTGQISPPDFWYDQDWNEWVLVLQGRAVLEFSDEEKHVELSQGDYVLIPAHEKHRIKWTDPERKTIWLAIHFW